MKNPNPSETTSTGMPADRARSTSVTKPGSCGWLEAVANRSAGSASIRPISQAISRREPMPPASYFAASASQSPGTCSAMIWSETSLSAIVPS